MHFIFYVKCGILKRNDCKNVEDMQDTIKDIFGPMFEAMLQGEMDSHLG